MMVTIVWGVDGSHVIELQSDAYHFNSQSFWDAKLPRLNERMLQFRVDFKSTYLPRLRHIHMDNPILHPIPALVEKPKSHGIEQMPHS
jgi:hypothetical protein